MEHKRDSFFLSNKKGKNKKQENGQKNDKEEFKEKQWHHFNKNRVGVQNGDQGREKEEKAEKKPFDKKTYRLKKYSKKYKLEQWEDQRKKKLVREYEKTKKKENLAGSYKPISFDDDVTDSNQEAGKFVRHPDLIEKDNSIAIQEDQQKKKDPFKKAKEQYNKVKQDKLQKQQEIEKAREEKRQKLQEYKKKKQERFKKLSKKTKKGQPMMTGRLELLLEKIQKNK